MLRAGLEVLGLAVVILGALYVVARVVQGGRSEEPEVDVGRTPSEWFTDSRTKEDGSTEVCVVRVEAKSGVVRERRVLRTLDTTAPDYKDQLDKALDDAYETMRVLNVNLRRR